MTGQIAFARTLRSLDADDSRGSKMGLFFAIILLAAWTWWLFAANIPQYEVSSHTRLDLNHNFAEADFSPTTRIHPGQPAQITTNDGQIIQAQVEKVINEPTITRVQFTLSKASPATSHQPPATPEPPATSHQPPATARIEVTRTSPATLVLHR
jgi:hypothetical protein